MRKAFLAACMLAGATLPAQAWDYPGHRIVGAIADIVLQRDHPQIADKVKKLLELKTSTGAEQRTLRDAAVFPDCAKNEPDFCKRDPTLEEMKYVLRNNVHKQFHYTNSPMQQKTYLPGGFGTAEADVVQMITHAATQLRSEDGKPNFKKNDVDLTDTEAVWLLAHLVGDIHQPLHVGQIYFDTTCERIVNPNVSRTIEAVTTLGGNAIALTTGQQRNLHLYWDETTIKNAMTKEGVDKDERAFAAKLAATAPPGWQTSGPIERWSEKWIEETLPLTEEAYRLPIRHDRFGDRRPSFPVATVSCGLNTAVPPTYEDWAAGVARAQLAKAGYRLAAILVEALKAK